MIAILSPAKKLNQKRSFPENLPFTEPVFKEKAAQLVERLRKLTPGQLTELMGISPKLAELNAERFGQWTTQGSYPAVFLYDGDTYKGLDIETFPTDKLADLQAHVRIVSGLYGLLRPLDLIMPYRLEMKTPLPVEGHKNLQSYWRDTVTGHLRNELQGRPLINLASKEYAAVVDESRLEAPVVHIDFKDYKRGAYRTIGLLAKRARGNMARWIALNKPEKPEELKAFEGLGYRFAPEVSDEHKMVFIRRQ